MLLNNFILILVGRNFYSAATSCGTFDLLTGEVVVVNPVDSFGEIDRPVYKFSSDQIEILPKQLYRGSFLVSIETLGGLQEILEGLTRRNFQFCRSVFLLFVENEEVTPHEIFQTLWTRKVYKIVMVKNKEVYTIDFKRFRCEDVVELSKRSCKDFLGVSKKNFFQLKGGCNLKLSWSERIPFAFEKGGKQRGIMVSLMDIISKRHNVSLRYLPPNKYMSQEYGTSDITLITAELTNGTSDVFLSSLIPLNVIGLIETPIELPKVLIFSKLLLISPKPSRISGFDLILQILPVKFIALILTSLAVSILIFSFANSSFKDVSLAVFALTINQTFNLNTLKFKSFLTLLIFSYTVVNVYIQSKLYSVGVQPIYGKRIETFGDLIESKNPLIIPNGRMLLLSLLHPGFKNVKYIPSWKPQQEEVENFFESNSYVTVANDFLLKLYPKHSGSYQSVYLDFEFKSIIVKKCLPLFEQIDGTISEVRENGLWTEWLKRLGYELTLERDVEGVEQKILLSLKDLTPVFYVLIIGNGVATFAFMLEVIKGRSSS